MQPNACIESGFLELQRLYLKSLGKSRNRLLVGTCADTPAQSKCVLFCKPSTHAREGTELVGICTVRWQAARFPCFFWEVAGCAGRGGVGKHSFGR